MNRNESIKALQEGLAHHREGSFELACECYQHALQSDPKNSDALHLLGLLTASRGNLNGGISLIRSALEMEPVFPAAWYNLGNLLQKENRLQESERAFRKALSLEPRSVNFLRNLASTLMRLSRHKEAADYYETALGLDPRNAGLTHNLGLAFLQQGLATKACEAFGKALCMDPLHLASLEDMGSALQELSRHGEAVRVLTRATELNPKNQITWCALGNSHKKLNALHEAQRCYERAVALDTGAQEPRSNLACLHLAKGELALAEAGFREVLRHHRDYTPAAWNLAVTLLSAGNYAEGWPAYEARWQNAFLAKTQRHFIQPLWTGEASLAGKTILVHAEQGFGDTLQFVRYIPLLAQQGATVHLQVQRGLLRLLSHIAGAASVTALDTAVGPFDFHCPLLSLPRAFGTRLETIPSKVPYLEARPSARQTKLVDAANDRPRKIGITWSGNPEHDNDHNRSIPLPLFSELLVPGGHTFLVLQKDRRPGDDALLAELGPRVVTQETLEDFDDTASLVAGMDLVITVDTATAHLAGALGREVWLLLPLNADWRWLRDREDSPWYPTLHLFRQTTLGDWAPVLKTVAGLLDQGG